MNTGLILEKLNELQRIKGFVLLLKIRFAEDEKLSQLVENAHNSLTDIMNYWLNDLSKNIEYPNSTAQKNSQDNFLSEEIADLSKNLKNLNDTGLSSSLQDLLTFFHDYEINCDLTSLAEQDLQNLRTEIYIINAKELA